MGDSTQVTINLTKQQRVIHFATTVILLIGILYSALAGMAPAPFLLTATLVGMAFTALLIWGIRSNRYVIISAIGWIVCMNALSINERFFFGSKGNTPWYSLLCELAAFILGFIVLFPAVVRAGRKYKKKYDKST